MRDGTVLGDVASIASNKSLTRKLNRPAECSFRVPSYLVNTIQADGFPLICEGRRQLAVTLDSTGLFFHGIIWNVEDDGDEDMVYTQVTAYDPMVIWRWRPARDNVDSYSGDAGNFSDPSFIQRNQTGPQIMQEILTATESPARIPSLAEGQTFLDLASSTWAGGGADLRGAPTNFPMTIAEIASLLTNTGELDIVVTPSTALGTGNEGFEHLGTVHCYNGNYGTDRTGTVHFDFATGNDNVRLFRRTGAMDTIGNKLWYYLGPKLDQQHWRYGLTGDSPDLPNPPGGDVNPYVPGASPLGDIIQDSRDAFGVYMQITAYDSFGNETGAFPLYARTWQVESLLRAQPRQMVYVTPTRDDPNGFEPGDFDIGDLVTINVGNKARVASSGASRVYGYTIDIDDDAVEALGELVTSPDQDSI